MRSADRMAVHLRPVTLRNWIVRPDAPALAVSGLSVGLLGFAHGGYFPEAWGWASIALCWCAICTVMLRESVDISIRVVWLGAGVAAALAWSAVSLFWTSDVTNGVQSVERDGLYLSLLIAAITVCERRARVYILGGVTAGIVIVSTYAVLTRLFPDRLGVFADPQGPGRLFVPLGYWNGEAELSAIGLAVVACGCAYLRSDALRIVAAGTVPTLSLAVFFTYSRGPILALAGGVVLLLILEPRRVSVLAWLMALAVAPAVLIVGAASLRGLSGAHYGIQSAGEGHRFALALLATTILSAAVGWGVSRLEVRVRANRRVRRAFLRAVPIAALAAVAIAVVVISPGATINRIRGSFDAAGPSTQSSARLESASPDSRLALWAVAWDSLKDHPLSGEGAGSFEWEWLLHRTQGTDTRFAHSVWLEAAAEGGLPGLLVMALVLLSPFVAAVETKTAGGGLRGSVCLRSLRYPRKLRLGLGVARGDGRGPLVWCSSDGGSGILPASLERVVPLRCGCGRGHRDRTKRVWPRRKPRHCGKREGGTSRRLWESLGMGSSRRSLAAMVICSGPRTGSGVRGARRPRVCGRRLPTLHGEGLVRLASLVCACASDRRCTAGGCLGSSARSQSRESTDRRLLL